jgi:hypothetical protein
MGTAMEARVLYIEEKIKRGELEIASLSGFRYRTGPTVDAQIILDQPQITLHCLDDEHRQAVFVEAPPGVDVNPEPFISRAQYENAQRLLTVPYETFFALADAIGNRFSRLIPMYSVGRCGGTLMSRALNRLDNVLSLDEPDPYTNLVHWRPGNRSRDAELTRLLQASTRLLYKPAKPGVDTLFIKFRPASIQIGDLMHKAFPTARYMFLYRNAEAWAQSAARSIQTVVGSANSDAADADPFIKAMIRYDLSKPFQAEAPERVSATATRNGVKPSPKASPPNRPGNRAFPLLMPYIRRNVRNQMTRRERLTVLFLVLARQIPILRGHFRLPLEYVEPFIHTIAPIKLLTLFWLSPMQRYVDLHAQGISMLAVQYETLVQGPLAALQSIFEYCGLPVEKAALAEGAFAEDSQKNTTLSRDRLRKPTHGNLPPESLVQLREILREHPPITVPDFVLPNSLDLRRARETVR